MPLILLGIVFAGGLFLYYLVSTKSTGSKSQQKPENADSSDTLKKDENVIFLPNDIEKAKQQHRKNR